MYAKTVPFGELCTNGLYIFMNNDAAPPKMKRGHIFRVVPRDGDAFGRDGTKTEILTSRCSVG